MSDETFLLRGSNDHLSVMGHLTACKKCGRKVLVEMVLFGVPHHSGVFVTCGDCVEISEQMRQEQSEAVSKVEAWLTAGQGTRQISS